MLSGIFSGITTSLNFEANTVLNALFCFYPFINASGCAFVFCGAFFCAVYCAAICLGGIFMFMLPISILLFLLKGFCLGIMWSIFCFSGLYGFAASIISLLEMAAYIKLFSECIDEALVNFRRMKIPRTNSEKLLSSANYIKKCINICFFSLLPMLIYVKIIII